MDRNQYKEWLQSHTVILDGASGTQMMKRGMPSGVCPELWALENPEALISVQQAYVAAGSEMVYTFTFGGSRFKLGDYGLADQTRDINQRLAALSRLAVGPNVLVAGDLAPCGRMLKPYGEADFEAVVDGFKEQVRGLLDGGVDLFTIETMMDLQEARAALLAVRELCDLPVQVTMTFETGMHTLTGTDPVSAVVGLQALGADAVGTNCSTGPEEMVAVIRAMKPHATVPLVAKPNAGKPRLIDGKTVFDMGPEQYASHVDALLEAGVNAIGGCCGTDPGFIAKLAAATAGKRTKPIQPPDRYARASSARRTVFIGADAELAVVGERLNCTKHPLLNEFLLDRDMDEVFDIARDQMDEGAVILDVNASVTGPDEAVVLSEMVQTLIQATPLPLCLSATDANALEAALRIYPGRSIVRAFSEDAGLLLAILPLAAKYGALVVLPQDSNGTRETMDGRQEVVTRIVEAAVHLGIPLENLLQPVDAAFKLFSEDNNTREA